MTTLSGRRFVTLEAQDSRRERNEAGPTLPEGSTVITDEQGNALVDEHGNILLG